MSHAKEQLKNGYSPYTGPIIFGSTSFDGSTIYGGGKAHRRHDLKPAEIEDFIFPLIEENESIEPVPAWARKFIVQVRDSLTCPPMTVSDGPKERVRESRFSLFQYILRIV